MPDPKRNGRPPLDASGQPSAAVHLKLAASDYDRLEQIRRDRRASSVQTVIRDGIRRLLKDEHGGSL